jgi:predicted dehydrogenase
MEKVRWGVLGTAKIALEKVIPGMMRSAHAEVRAIASRTPERAREAAGRLGIPKAYGSYAELLADPGIEAVYIPLPNHMHVPAVLEAAEAGKHVLCEKPIGLDARDAERLRALRGRVLVMEAFMVRCHPQWLRVRDLVRSGAVGEPRAIQVSFAYHNDAPANIRNIRDYGGGAVLDIGCYAVVCGRWVYEAEPKRVVALVDRDPRFGTDRTTSGLLDFGAGRQLAFTVSTQLVPSQRVQVFGTSGRIEVEIPFNAPQGKSVRLLLDDGSVLAGASARAETIPEADQYALQADLFSRAVRGEATLEWGVEDAIMNMRILDALMRSEASGRWEEP